MRMVACRVLLTVEFDIDTDDDGIVVNASTPPAMGVKIEPTPEFREMVTRPRVIAQWLRTAATGVDNWTPTETEESTHG